MRSWPERLFKIREDERSDVLRLFGYLLCLIGAAVIIGRTLSATLFLSRLNPRLLPYTYVLSAVVVSVASALYARRAERLSSPDMVFRFAVLFALGCALLRALIEPLGDELLLLALIYVFFDLVSDIGLIQLWTLAQERFDARQSKRLFSLIGAGGTIAGLIMGGLIGPLASAAGTANLLLFAAALLLGCAGFARGLRPARAVGRAARPRAGQLRARDLRGLAALAIVSTAATILVDYQWKLSARAAYLGDEAQLAGYFGRFAFVTSATALSVQLLLTSRILERWGVHRALLMLPLALLPGAVMGLMGGWTLFFSTLTKGADSALRYALNEPATQLLYRPLNARQRAQAKALLNGVCKPTCAAITGLLIAAGVQLAPGALPLAIPLLLLIWAALALAARGHYISALQRALEQHRSLACDTWVIDAQARAALEQALEGDRAHHALAILAELPQRGRTSLLLPLLRRETPELRTAALELLAKTSGKAAHAALPSLAADDPRERAAAIACMLQDEETAHDAERALLQMSSSCQPDERAAAATAIGLLGAPSALLRSLLRDPEVRVRIEAAGAAERAPDASCGPALVELLISARTRPAAKRALVALGSAPLLEGALGGGPSSIRTAACAVLGQLGPAGQMALLRASRSEDEPLRHAAVMALSEAPQSSLHPLCALELERFFILRRIRSALEDVQQALLGEALDLRCRRAKQRVLHLLERMFPQLHGARHALLETSAENHANALELLESTVGPNLRKPALAMFDPQPGERTPTRREALEALLNSSDPWLICCALWEIQRTQELSLRAQAYRLSAHPNPLVRETAMRSSAQGDAA